MPKVDLPRRKRRRCAASGRGGRGGGGGGRSWREKEQGEVIITRYIFIRLKKNSVKIECC